jgi:hypothetical protein
MTEIKPSRSCLIQFGVIAGFLLVMGVIGVWPGRSPLVTVGAFLSALYFWLYGSTGRVVIKDGVLSLRRFWRTTWSVPINEAVVGSGAAGERVVLPALVVCNRSGKKIGFILKVQFPTEQLEELERRFSDPHGAGRLNHDQPGPGSPSTHQEDRRKTPGAPRAVVGLSIVAASIAMFFAWGFHFHLWGERIGLDLVHAAFYGWLAVAAFGVGYYLGGVRSGISTALGLCGFLLFGLLIGFLRGKYS